MADIVVVGAGFVGLSFAIAARQAGFDVVVQDRKKAPSMPEDLSSNVIALNEKSVAFLEEIGAWQYLPSEFRTSYSTMRVADGTGTGAITFNADDANLPRLGHIVDQSALLSALGESGRAAGLQMDWEHNADVVPGDARLLIGADGAHSQIREKLGLRKFGYNYDQTATVCLARMSQDHERCAFQWFLESGPLAMLPLSDARSVAVVWSNFDDLAQQDEDEFRVMLAEASEDELGAVLDLGPRFSFPLMQQHALQYVDEGVALLGDSAHAIHPLAGQGANLGFADARSLVTEISAARLEGLSPGSLKILKRYESERRIRNQVAGAAMEGFHRLFTARAPWAGLLRSKGLSFVNSNDRLKRVAIEAAAGIL